MQTSFLAILSSIFTFRRCGSAGMPSFIVQSADFHLDVLWSQGTFKKHGESGEKSVCPPVTPCALLITHICCPTSVCTLSCSNMMLWFSSVLSLSRVRLFVTPWSAALQDSLSITDSQSPPKPMSTESVMPSNHLILCRPLLLLPSVFPSIKLFSNESALCKRWPKYWSFSFNISRI